MEQTINYYIANNLIVSDKHDIKILCGKRFLNQKYFAISYCLPNLNTNKIQFIISIRSSLMVCLIE